jgi:UDP:flavonoid glycosyltransferase YjiC (YdhE family)
MIRKTANVETAIIRSRRSIQSMRPGRYRSITRFLAAALVLAATGCGSPGSGRDVTIALEMTVWPYGVGAGERSYSWTLRCNPLGGSLPHGDRACFLLATDPQPFAQAPPRKPCLEIYGGPAVARVIGTLRGRRIDATLNRVDSCQIDRWERVAYLFPRYV